MLEERAVVPGVLAQHLEEAISLYTIRTELIAGAQVGLRELRSLDDRIFAHLDGLATAGERGWPICEAALEDPTAGVIFTASVLAIEAGRQDRWERTCAAAQAAEARRGLIAALGWLEPPRLKGVVAGALAAEDCVRRLIGVAACGVHRVDPGDALLRWTSDGAAEVRARALRTAGEIGRRQLASSCVAAIANDDTGCRSWASWSAVLLGERGRALQELAEIALLEGPQRTRAFRLVVLAMPQDAAHGFLQRLAGVSAKLRWLIEGCGVGGDPVYAPWLIGQMTRPETARVAGEAFTLITGADLAALGLETTRPDDFESGPTDDPDDSNVEMDPDEGLPWPDVAKVEQWWAKNAGRFQKGQRYFMGAPVTRAHCIDVLKNGYQRQRILAAHYLCLLEPGTPLFNTSAPAWRQQRLLAQMT